MSNGKTDGGLRFTPSRVEGLAHVTGVAVFPERLELCVAGRWVSFRFDDIAKWPRPVWLRRAMARLGLPPAWLPVGERDCTRQRSASSASSPSRLLRFTCPTSREKLLTR